MVLLFLPAHPPKNREKRIELEWGPGASCRVPTPPWG